MASRAQLSHPARLLPAQSLLGNEMPGFSGPAGCTLMPALGAGAGTRAVWVRSDAQGAEQILTRLLKRQGSNSDLP